MAAAIFLVIFLIVVDRGLELTINNKVYNIKFNLMDKKKK